MQIFLAVSVHNGDDQLVKIDSISFPQLNGSAEKLMPCHSGGDLPDRELLIIDNVVLNSNTCETPETIGISERTDDKLFESIPIQIKMQFSIRLRDIPDSLQF
jgi:hypothetical protein